jgi:hypothetical protein
MNAVKAALIRWVIIAHMALCCVEVEAFRDLIQTLACTADRYSVYQEVCGNHNAAKFTTL